ncbi:ABC transporter ATP-binding protein [Angustibacter speluncae]
MVGARRTYGATTALDGVDLLARAGEVTALLGPNGAGKTTLVECAVGLRRLDGGTVRVLGTDPWRAGPGHRAAVEGLLQDGGLLASARPLGVLRHLAALHRHLAEVDALAARLGIDAFARTAVRRLSGGQRQRLALAAALVGRPRVVFLDEPTAGLDPQARLVVREVVEDLVADDVAVVLTTHDLDEAARAAAHVVIVDHGRVLAAGSPAELLAGRGQSVRFATPPGIDVSGLRRALPETVTLAGEPGGGWRVSGEIDPSVLATLTAWCANQGVMPGGLQVGGGDLEDLFLELTGRELR